jgi:hypothetical protein
MFDLLDAGVLDGFGLAAVVEGGMAVLEELLEPAVDLVGVELVFIALLRSSLVPKVATTQAPRRLACLVCPGRRFAAGGR